MRHLRGANNTHANNHDAGRVLATRCSQGGGVCCCLQRVVSAGTAILRARKVLTAVAPIRSGHTSEPEPACVLDRSQGTATLRRQVGGRLQPDSRPARSSSKMRRCCVVRVCSPNWYKKHHDDIVALCDSRHQLRQADRQTQHRCPKGARLYKRGSCAISTQARGATAACYAVRVPHPQSSWHRAGSRQECGRSR